MNIKKKIEKRLPNVGNIGRRVFAVINEYTGVLISP